MQDNQVALSINEVAKRTSIGRSTIFSAIRDGKLRAVKVGNRTLIRIEDLKAFLDSLPLANRRAG